jgi:hypothetical protein
VAVELLRLTEEHGIDSWVSPALNNKPYSIAGVSRWMQHSIADYLVLHAHLPSVHLSCWSPAFGFRLYICEHAEGVSAVKSVSAV